MKNKLLEILLKILLGIAELAFVGILGYLRILNTGWLLILFGLGLVLWVIFHLGLMAAFIASFKLKLPDVALYLALHFFYLWAWLLQSDGGDSDRVSWTIQTLYSSSALDLFLAKWGDTLFWTMSIASFICYLLICILLLVRLVAFLNTRKKACPRQNPAFEVRWYARALNHPCVQPCLPGAPVHFSYPAALNVQTAPDSCKMKVQRKFAVQGLKTALF